jgi:NADH:ubiquinone oxidoreductase subunit E
MSWDLEEAIAYHRRCGAPADQNAVIGLLGEIQQENGGSIPRYMLPVIAEAYGVKESFFLAFIKRIPRLRLADTHRLELCAGSNCGKRTELAAVAEKLCKNSKVELKFVPCMRLCGKGPNIKWNGILYHQADEKLLRMLLEEIG